jgi:hypothetical protein
VRIDPGGQHRRTINTYALHRHARVVLVQPECSRRTTTLMFTNLDRKELIIEGSTSPSIDAGAQD